MLCPLVKKIKIKKIRMEKKVKKNYESPQLTVVTFRTERGYASSGMERDGFLSLIYLGDNGSENIEPRDDNGSYWGGNDWN